MGSSIALRALVVAVMFISQAAAHFLLNYPPTIGFDDDLEGNAPCGSFTPNFSTDNVTDFHVSGDSIAVTSIHPQATWLFRATLDITASGNWTSLLPAVQQTGLGDYCERNLVLPSSWAGSKGILGVVQDAPDGILYQCATVNFVAGTIAPPTVCTNVTGLTAVFTTDVLLSSLPASVLSTSTATSVQPFTTGGSAATTTAPSGSSTSTAKSMAAKVNFENGTGSLVWVMIITIGSLLAFLM